MSQQLVKTQTNSTVSTKLANNPLEEVVNDYLSTIQTKNGSTPTPSQVKKFTAFCLAANLNPFKNQAYLVGYDSKNGPSFTTITAIDGYRAIAHRTGLYCGGEGGLEVNEKNFPVSATFTTKKLIQNQICAFQATVYYDETVQTVLDYSSKDTIKPQIPNPIWSKRPKGQLMKCAEAAALRMAFPEDLDGAYIDAELAPETLITNQEEIGSSSHHPFPPTPPTQAKKTYDPKETEGREATSNQVGLIISLVEWIVAKTKEEKNKYITAIQNEFDVELMTDLTFNVASKIIERLQTKLDSVTVKKQNSPNEVMGAFGGAGEEILRRLKEDKLKKAAEDLANEEE